MGGASSIPPEEREGLERAVRKERRAELQEEFAALVEMANLLSRRNQARRSCAKAPRSRRQQEPKRRSDAPARAAIGVGAS